MANVNEISNKIDEFEKDMAELLAKHNAELSVDLNDIEVTFYSGVVDTICFSFADATGFEAIL